MTTPARSAIYTSGLEIVLAPSIRTAWGFSGKPSPQALAVSWREPDSKLRLDFIRLVRIRRLEFATISRA
jgi:hypothetical protein